VLDLDKMFKKEARFAQPCGDGVIPYVSSRQSPRLSRVMRVSRRVLSGWARDPEASVSNGGLTLTLVTLSSYAEPLLIRT
jgi:hypothetical protein